MPLSAGEYALEAIGLSKQYGGRHAVVGGDLRVRPGEVHGLVGQNGAGKTTLMRMLLGLVRPDTGVVRLLGREAPHGAPIPPAVAGFVDTPRFYPYLSGRRNLELLARLDGADATSAARIDEAVKEVGLEPHADVRVGGYSAGTLQRLGLAAALIRAPRLLLLDEPTSSLDPAGARDLRDLIRRLATGGCAVLMSSHDMDEVEDLCSTLTVMHRGRIAFAGPLEALRRRAPPTVRRLETSADDAAVALGAAHPALGLSRADDALEITGADGEVDAYVIALGREGIAVRALAREIPPLETLVLALTGEWQDAGGASARGKEEPHPGAEDGDVERPLRAKAVLDVAAVEWAKLRAQPQPWLLIAICLLAPLAFAVAMKGTDTPPEDTLFGRLATTSGFAVPLVVLGFAASWGFPVLVSVVSGDLFSSEDRLGTWPTLLTRSRSRGELFAGKVLAGAAFSLLAVAVLALASVAAGTCFIGRQPLLGLTGTLLPERRALGLVAMAWGSVIAPALAVGALAMFVSVATRSSVAGVGVPVLVGFTMELLGLVRPGDAVRAASITSAFVGWHGLFAEPRFYGPLVRGTALSAVYWLVCLAWAHALVRRRDMGR